MELPPGRLNIFLARKINSHTSSLRDQKKKKEKSNSTERRERHYSKVCRKFLELKKSFQGPDRWKIPSEKTAA